MNAARGAVLSLTSTSGSSLHAAVSRPAELRRAAATYTPLMAFRDREDSNAKAPANMGARAAATGAPLHLARVHRWKYRRDQPCANSNALAAGQAAFARALSNAVPSRAAP